MRSCRRRNKAALALALGLAPALLFASDEAVFAPMKAEMRRSLKSLKFDAFDPPYFLAYRLVDQRRYNVLASFGSVAEESDEHSRPLYVEARCGGRAFDNTDLNFRGAAGAAGEDPGSLRARLWILTEAGFKGAVSGFLEKKAKRATEFEAEVFDDFSVETATAVSRNSSPQDVDRPRFKRLAEAASAVFRGYPFVYGGDAVARARRARRYLLTSEGTRLATAADNVPNLLRVSAMTRAEDGMRLDNHKAWVFRDFSELPPLAKIREEAGRVARELGDMRQAPVQAPASAPAILDPEFTGVLFHEALGHKLEGQRQRDPQQSQVFRDMVGRRIIPEFLSLWDDPTLAFYEGAPLSGHYDFDSEGVPAQRVVLVDRGILKSFLMSRWPIKGFPNSNGHGRADASSRPVGRMANLIVRAEAPVPRAELTARLLELVRKAGKPYGFLLVGSFGGENPNSRAAAQTLEVRPRLVYRLDAKTGEATLVRGVSLVGTPLVVLNRIVAAADDAKLANGFVCGAESGYVPVSQIAPSVLVSEVELQRLPEDRERPPILPSPFHAKEP